MSIEDCSCEGQEGCVDRPQAPVDELVSLLHAFASVATPALKIIALRVTLSEVALMRVIGCWFTGDCNCAGSALTRRYVALQMCSLYGTIALYSKTELKNLLFMEEKKLFEVFSLLFSFSKSKTLSLEHSKSGKLTQKS